MLLSALGPNGRLQRPCSVVSPLPLPRLALPCLAQPCLVHAGVLCPAAPALVVCARMWGVMQVLKARPGPMSLQRRGSSGMEELAIASSPLSPVDSFTKPQIQAHVIALRSEAFIRRCASCLACLVCVVAIRCRALAGTSLALTQPRTQLTHGTLCCTGIAR